jgi:hypothetical protein
MMVRSGAALMNGSKGNDGGWVRKKGSLWQKLIRGESDS